MIHYIYLSSLLLICITVCLITWWLSNRKYQKAWLQIKMQKKQTETELQHAHTQISTLESTAKIIESNLRETKDTLTREQEQKQQLYTQVARLQTENNNMVEKLGEQESKLEDLQKKFNQEFENLANRILEEKSHRFARENKKNMADILHPLQEKITAFEKRVEDTNKESIDRHAMLRQQIIGLKDLNLKISAEAINLTKALKGEAKTQGNWGELVLENVLEKSGLEKNREYFVQQSFHVEDQEGKNRRVMPDVILHLPDNKKMIIDAKVSLVAYEAYINEPEEAEKEKHLKNHVLSIKKHISQLSDKNYQDIYQMNSPDFVLLFIPIEPAFALATNYDNQLYNLAFEKNIVIVTPSTLLATLRTVDTMWNNEKQQQNAIEIAKQAGLMYDKFVDLTEDLIKLGKQMRTTSHLYETTMKKLTGKGNIIRKIEQLKKLGIKQKKHVRDELIERANE